MRKFNYLEDHGVISTAVKGYINQLLMEINLLKETNNDIYSKTEITINKFKDKYPNLYMVSKVILDDLLKSENFEYYHQNKRYPDDASSLGLQFEKDLKKIFDLEEQLKNIALVSWENDLTKFDDIVNGEDFLVVGHASYNLPGTVNCRNYVNNGHKNLYISCSLFSGNELNTFNDLKTVYLIEVDKNNYIASSSDDSVTADFNYPSFETLSKIDDNHYIKVGYTNDSKKSVTTIATPKLIEKLSLEREINQRGEMYNYDGLLTNEVVLDRTKSKYIGALLISNGCDLLLDEYLNLKQNNVKFKCINKGLYRTKNNMTEFTSKDYNDFIDKFNRIENYSYLGDKLNELLLGYYYEVILPMNYSSDVMLLINDKFSKYIEIPKGRVK